MPVMQSPPGAETVIDGRHYLYFAGTGYLGLQGHPEVIRAACRATEQYGIASATTRAGFGNTPPLLEVERLAARLFGMDGAFYFMSGYVGPEILARLIQPQVDAVFVDECSHYCVLEAARRFGRPVHEFHHADADDLARKLSAHVPARARPLVMTDGVFSARGTIAPLAEYRAILARYPASSLVVDDAHGLGVLGANGRGTLEHAGLPLHGVNWDVPESDAACRGQPSRLSDRRDACATGSEPDSPCLLLCGTLSKALGGFGGIIPGSAPFVEQIKSSSHYYAGASAPPVPAAAATARALELVAEHPEMRARLWENVRAVKSGLAALGFEVDHTPVPIICLTLGTAENMQRLQRELADRGILIAYMAAYAGLGPEGALRLAVFSTHTPDMIARLLDELRRLA